MSEAGVELSLKVSAPDETTGTLQGGRIGSDEEKATLVSAGGEEQDNPGSLSSLEQELLTLETQQPPELPQVTEAAALGWGQMLSVHAAGSSQDSRPLKSEQAGAGEARPAAEEPPEHAAQGQNAGGQGANPIGATAFPQLALQPEGYGMGLYGQFEGPVKVEDGAKRAAQERPADSGAGGGQRYPGEGMPPGMELGRQNTDESLGRHLEGGRDGEDGGTEGEEHEGRGQANKKQRLVWTAELHSRFMNAVNHLGVKNAVPKTILQLMNVEGMTRENVASHLQKYRLYLKRLAGLPPNARLSPELVPGSGHLYPYVHQPHEVPPAIIMPPQPVHQGYPPPSAPYYPPSHRGDVGGAPLLGSPSPPAADASAPGQKAGEGRSTEAGPAPYPSSAGSIPPSPPHFGYTPEMYGGYSSLSHGGWHPLPGPGPGPAPSGQYRTADVLPGSPVPQGQGPQQYSSTASVHYGGPGGGSMYGAAAGSPAGVGSPASMQGSAYGYPGGAYGSPAAVGSPGGQAGSPQGGQRGPPPGLSQYSVQGWQQDHSQGGGFSQQFWVPPGPQDWQKRWPDSAPPQRKW